MEHMPCVSQYSRCFMHLSNFILPITLCGKYHYPIFTDRETEAQKF